VARPRDGGADPLIESYQAVLPSTLGWDWPVCELVASYVDVKDRLVSALGGERLGGPAKFADPDGEIWLP
jgi:hypothetical protein